MEIEEMSFQEWLNEMFGCEVDLYDLPEEEVASLYEQWKGESK